MRPPSVSELQDFTLNSYKNLLEYLRQNYKIIPFCEVDYEDVPYLILRHDIDISLQDALKMASLEKDLNVKSTYFILLSSSFYNIFENQNMSIIKRISEYGHEIGLHYYPAQYMLYNQNPRKTLKAEVQLLEVFLGKKVRCISRHGPFSRDPFAATREYMNANHPYLRADLFVHESDRAWTTLEGLSLLLNNVPKRVQLLVHPENWQDIKIDRNSLLEKHVKAIEEKLQFIKGDLLVHYRKDELVTNYEQAIKKPEPAQPNRKSSTQRQFQANWRSLGSYYFTHSRIGWNLRELRGKLKDSFLF